VFPLAMGALWVLLAISLAGKWNTAANATTWVRIAKLLGLALLFVVPIAIYIASGSDIYPAVNPDTGGPTGTSQLESSLMVVAILLIIPFGLVRRKAGYARTVFLSWMILGATSLLCSVLSRADESHHNPSQYISLASLLIWIPLMPAYYRSFEWSPSTRRWRAAFLWWWALLVISGWVMFLPGVLDHFKFTDGLVGHSFIATAGFLSALLIFVMVQLLGDDDWIFTRAWSFHLWNWSVLGYIVVMFVAGWFEGSDPAFTIVPGGVRNLLYVLRLATGILMLVASLEWFQDASVLLREHKPDLARAAEEKVA
jgi:cytochrome c oxidase cbb3-type subunit I